MGRANEPRSGDIQAGLAARSMREMAAAKWVLENEPHDTEDRVFRLRTLPYIDAEQLAVQKEVNALLAKQQVDGGWTQAEGMASDAYATGTVLTALQEVGRLPSDHPAVKLISQGLQALAAGDRATCLRMIQAAAAEAARQP